ncbi:DUF938 domain-containing protein [Shewanella maritima]|uniref:DUF938 domain-containing protein n=1 Tax=Shewanella maritima TaxID=2520507 RepID=UPI003735180E
MQLDDLPFSRACENNKQYILSAITPWIASHNSVIEIGSGTGQHATYFSHHLPHIQWQPTDVYSNLDGLRLRVNAFQQQCPNLSIPVELDVATQWPAICLQSECIFTANTLHIISKSLVSQFFQGIGTWLQHRNVNPTHDITALIIYGPFNYQGQYTSESNRQFDQWLRTRDSQSGIRSIEWICELAQSQGLKLNQDIAMPANNRLLQFTQL